MLVGPAATGEGLPCCVVVPLVACHRPYPGGTGRAQLLRPARHGFPLLGGGSASTTYIFEACSTFTQVMARRLAGLPKATLCHRRLSTVRYLPIDFDCFLMVNSFQDGSRTRGNNRTFARRTPSGVSRRVSGRILTRRLTPLGSPETRVEHEEDPPRSGGLPSLRSIDDQAREGLDRSTCPAAGDRILTAWRRVTFPYDGT